MQVGELDDYLEWVVEKEFVLEMEDGGWECLKADKLKRGWTDQIIFGPKKQTVFVEFKRLGAKPRRGEKLQDYYRGRFADMGFDTYKITGKRQADALRAKLLKEKP